MPLCQSILKTPEEAAVFDRGDRHSCWRTYHGALSLFQHVSKTPGFRGSEEVFSIFTIYNITHSHAFQKDINLLHRWI
jgi:hypothetical protein